MPTITPRPSTPARQALRTPIASSAQETESNVAIVSVGGEVRKLLELTAIDKTIPVFDAVDQAITAVLTVDSQ